MIKDDLKNMTDDMIKAIKCFLTQNQPSQEEVKENKVSRSHSHIEKTLTHLYNKTLDQKSIQDAPY